VYVDYNITFRLIEAAECLLFPESDLIAAGQRIADPMSAFGPSRHFAHVRFRGEAEAGRQASLTDLGRK